MKQLPLDDILCKSAERALALQDREGFFPKGHNGPWLDEDTPVRTTAHWAITIFKAYRITGREIFLNAAVKACDYLISKERRPYGYTFYCRTGEKDKNMCNGLVGQAWAVEPLILIGEGLNRAEYLDAARQTVLLHPYDRNRHVWNNVEIDGKILGINRTLNQQIWFAAVSLITGKILHDKKMYDTAVDFFVHLPGLAVYMEDKGLIRHRFEISRGISNRIAKKMTGEKKDNGGDNDTLKTLSEGYLSFILYGLALAYAYSGKEAFWGDEKLKAMISGAVAFMNDQFPFGCGEKTGYRWCYNPTGIEMAYVLQVFEKYLNLESAAQNISAWLGRQFGFYYDNRKNLMSRNTGDPVILSSRIYEAVRLNNYSLSLSDDQ
jgi:hypothetical protein